MKYIKGDYVSGVNRSTWVSQDGRIKLVPRGAPERTIEWCVSVDGIDLNQRRGTLAKAKACGNATINHHGGPVPGPTVLWVYDWHVKRHEVVACTFDEALEVSGLPKGDVERVMIAPRQPAALIRAYVDNKNHVPTLNENLVHAIGEALGVDTGTIHESKFNEAVRMAEKILAKENAA